MQHVDAKRFHETVQCEILPQCLHTREPIVLLYWKMIWRNFHWNQSQNAPAGPMSLTIASHTISMGSAWIGIVERQTWYHCWKRSASEANKEALSTLQLKNLKLSKSSFCNCMHLHRLLLGFFICSHRLMYICWEPTILRAERGPSFCTRMLGRVNDVLKKFMLNSLVHRRAIYLARSWRHQKLAERWTVHGSQQSQTIYLSQQTLLTRHSTC